MGDGVRVQIRAKQVKLLLDKTEGQGIIQVRGVDDDEGSCSPRQIGKGFAVENLVIQELCHQVRAVKARRYQPRHIEWIGEHPGISARPVAKQKTRAEVLEQA